MRIRFWRVMFGLFLALFMVNAAFADGDVQASVSQFNSLDLFGDANSNSVLVFDLDFVGKVVLGINGTTVNGNQWAIFPTLIGTGVTAEMGDGNDLLAIIDTDLSDFFISMGAGDDTVGFFNVDISALSSGIQLHGDAGFDFLWAGVGIVDASSIDVTGFELILN